MALETGTYIDSLVATNPSGADDRSTADDHLRLLKSTILATFPNVTGAVTATQAELNSGYNAVPQSSKMLFQQATAPTGWTKETTHNDKSIRVVTGTPGSGGTTAFTTVFSRTATDSHALTTAELPAHDHGSAGDHVHNASYGSAVGGSSTTSEITAATGWRANQIQAAGAHTHTSVGSNSGHTHALTNFDLQYVDVMIASKD